MSFDEEEGRNEEADKKLAGADLFLEDWDSVVRVQNQATLDGSPVALAIAAFMQDNGEYEAPASALHKELETAAEGINIDTARDKMWPKSARWLWRRIKEVQPVLEAIGVEATRNHTATGSKITLLKKSENDVSNVSAHEKPIDKGETPDDNPDISDESNVSLASNVSSNVSSDSRHLSGSDDTDDTDIIFSSTTSGDVRAEECLHGMIGGCDQCRKNRLSPFFDGLDDDTDEGSSEDDGERRIEWLS